MGQVEEANKALAREMIDALTRADVDWVTENYAEDVRLWVTGSLPFSGEQGKAGALASMPAVLDLFPKGLTFSIRSMVAEGDSVAIEANSTGETFRGDMYEQEYHFLMRARDGKIVEWKEYMDTEHARKVLVGSEAIMRVIHVDDDPEYGVALGSILVSLLEPEAGHAREFNRWYERDHFYAGCMSGQHFFSGRRFVAPRALKALRYPASSRAVDDASIGSFLALYWMERGHHREAEDWALERVLWLYGNGRMGNVTRTAVHASFYMHQWAALRDEDGVPPEVALDRGFPGVAMVLSERPEGVSADERTRFMLEERLPHALAGSTAALCLSLTPLELPKTSPAYRAPEPGFDRRHLEIYFLDETPEVGWAKEIAPLGPALADAGMGEVLFTAGFIPTVPGTDRYVDEV